MFGLFDALALVAVVVAALGIVNTLTVSVLERVRELGVLRAAGMTRDQVRRTVVVEAGILGLVGAALGIVTGLIAAVALIGCRGGGPLVLDIPWVPIATARHPRHRRSRWSLPGIPPVWQAGWRSWRGPARIGPMVDSARRTGRRDRGRGLGTGGTRREMITATPRLNRLPADERGITIADFLVPIRVGERMGTRVRHAP